MILVISSETDLHARVILERLVREGRETALLNLVKFPKQLQLSINYHGNGHDYRILGSDDGNLPLNKCHVIWWRRPLPFELSSEINASNYRAFAFNECYEAFSGLWLTLDTFWVNHPTRDQEAARKVYQLKVAQAVGLEIPVTLITNSPAEAHAFVDAQGNEGTIYKSFSATLTDWRETRLLKPEELEKLDSVKFAPVIFQEYVPAQADLRVTMIGKKAFAAAIYSQETSYKVDYRIDINAARVEPFELPQKVTDHLNAMMERLGLVYGAIDLRLTPDGRYVFLEINPAGQWLFIEERTTQPITETFAQLMVDHDLQRT